MAKIPRPHGRVSVVRRGPSAGNVLRDHTEASGEDFIALNNRGADTPLSPLARRRPMPWESGLKPRPLVSVRDTVLR